MLCSYRYHVRQQQVGSPPRRPGTVKRETTAPPAPAGPPPAPAIVDTPPHVEIVRQYAW